MDMTWSAQLTLISPALVLAAGVLILLLLDAFLPKNWPAGLCAAIVLVASSVVSLVYALPHRVDVGQTVFSGSLYVDSFSQVVFLLLTLGALLSLLLSVKSLREFGVEKVGEYYALFLLATLGAGLFANAADFITLFLGLELMSMPLYCLCGAALFRRKSAEASFKYFFLGSFASAFLLFGAALLYGLSGSLALSDAAAVSGAFGATGYFAAGLVLIGVAFKISAVPFHFWAPDVYEGAPAPVTAFMACVIKAAAVVVGMRVLWTSFSSNLELVDAWTGLVWVLAFLTIVVGNVLAIQQRSMKRMLAYSSIAHAGYMMMAFLSFSDGMTAILFYIISYTFMTLGAFGVLMLVCSDEDDDITRFNRLGYRAPVLAAAMSVFLFSLAGLPPGMAGLLGKFYIFNAVVKADFAGLAIVGVLASAVSCFYYLRVVVAMYFVPSENKEAELPLRPVGLLAGSALALCLLATIGLGIIPSPIYEALAEVAKLG